MDIDGLGRLIEEKHAQTDLMFKTVTKALDDQKVFCSKSMECMADKIREHEKTLTQIKTIGSLLTFVWGAIVLFIGKIWGR
jgi:hypothetical protein